MPPKILGEVSLIAKSNAYKMKTTTIMKKSTYDKKNEKTSKADGWSEATVGKFFAENKKTLFKDGESYQINLLFSYGWRAGVRFTGTSYNMYDRGQHYDDDTDVDDTIYAIQVIKI